MWVEAVPWCMTALRPRFLSALFGCLAAVAGCAHPEEDGAAPSSESELSTSATDAGAPYTAQVTANGAGCPQGSWAATVSPDGASVVVTFEEYASSVSSSNATTVTTSAKTCVLGIDLHTPALTSFALSGFSFDGHARLESWRAHVGGTVDNWFQGNPLPGMSFPPRGIQLQPPFDDDIAYAENIVEMDRTWSPCADTSHLNVRSRIVTTMMPQTIAADPVASIDVRRMKWDLVWRKC